MKTIILMTLLLQFVLLASSAKAGSGNGEFQLRSFESVPDAGWKRLSDKSIFFGHQSVGNNIMAGISDVMREKPHIRLNIQETSDPRALSKAVFAHYKVGENHKPLSKNEGFRRYMDAGIGGKADFAFYKYCYVDIKADTEVNRLFNEYRANMAALKARHPGTRFVHVTVPVTVVQSGWKASVKKLMGKPVGGYADNIKRNEFNELMRKEYAGREPIFDLAAVEAARPAGQRETFSANGREYMALAPEYASDGRHLNEKGRRHVAEQMLLMLLALSGEGK